jgi:hypothetical protein
MPKKKKKKIHAIGCLLWDDDKHTKCSELDKITTVGRVYNHFNAMTLTDVKKMIGTNPVCKGVSSDDINDMIEPKVTKEEAGSCKLLEGLITFHVSRHIANHPDLDRCRVIVPLAVFELKKKNDKNMRAMLLMEKYNEEQIIPLGKYLSTRTVTPDKFNDLYMQVEEILHELQSDLQFVHGDLHSGNVLVNTKSRNVEDHHVVLADFGMSTIVVNGILLSAKDDMLQYTNKVIDDPQKKTIRDLVRVQADLMVLLTSIAADGTIQEKNGDIVELCKTAIGDPVAAMDPQASTPEGERFWDKGGVGSDISTMLKKAGLSKTYKYEIPGTTRTQERQTSEQAAALLYNYGYPDYGVKEHAFKEITDRLPLGEYMFPLSYFISDEEKIRGGRIPLGAGVRTLTERGRVPTPPRPPQGHPLGADVRTLTERGHLPGAAEVISRLGDTVDRGGAFLASSLFFPTGMQNGNCYKAVGFALGERAPRRRDIRRFSPGRRPGAGVTLEEVNRALAGTGRPHRIAHRPDLRSIAALLAEPAGAFVGAGAIRSDGMPWGSDCGQAVTCNHCFAYDATRKIWYDRPGEVNLLEPADLTPGGAQSFLAELGYRDLLEISQVHINSSQPLYPS